MAHMKIGARTRVSDRLLLAGAWQSVRADVAALVAWRRAVATRWAMADMTPEQLSDIGLEAPRRGPDDIKAAILVTNLMSMR